MTDDRRAAYAALLLRLASGGLMLAHGLLKVLVFTLPGTAKFFGSLGLPAALAYAVVAAELIGGALMLSGLFYRAACLALVPVLIGAAFVHAPNGWLFSAPNGGWEFPAFWTLVLVAQALLGPGVFALGALLNRSPTIPARAAA
jgi:putative oxidoreductase